MRKLLVIALVLAVVVLVVFRQRLFLRDPLAKVERNGQEQKEFRVYINYFNDVLVEDLEGNRRFLVQAKDAETVVPGSPLHLQCVRGMACLTESDYAPTVPLGGKGYVPQTEMTSAFVSFLDADGSSLRVSLR
ncbi:hypothetical protein BH10ACI4_BH10ACI4_31860 [soil metagenome]